MPEVVVYILEGRTLEQKRGLVKDITAAVVKNGGGRCAKRHTGHLLTVNWLQQYRRLNAPASR